jgi:SAM-dependent methyltransferase
MPRPDGWLDRIICKNVLEYVADVAATLREVHRKLRPGGCVPLSDDGKLERSPIPAAVAKRYGS